jgi:hypothetical protein
MIGSLAHWKHRYLPDNVGVDTVRSTFFCKDGIKSYKLQNYKHQGTTKK